MEFALKILILASAALLILLILMQQRGASLGAGFGASSELYTTRRGTDKSLHEFTIVVAVVFVGSLIIGLIEAKYSKDIWPFRSKNQKSLKTLLR